MRGDKRLCACGCGLEAKRVVYGDRFKSWRSYAPGHAPSERCDVTIPDDKARIAYAAGILDGEGCIFAKAYLRKDNCFQTILQVQVAMCSESVVGWLRENFGGRVYTDVPTTGFVAHKRRFAWQLRGKRIAIFLRAVLPYLIEKRVRAEIAIQLADAMSSGNGKRAQLSEAERSERERLAAVIKGFNRCTRSEDFVN